MARRLLALTRSISSELRPTMLLGQLRVMCGQSSHFLQRKRLISTTRARAGHVLLETTHSDAPLHASTSVPFDPLLLLKKSSSPGWTSEMDQCIIQMHQSGSSWRQIEKVLGKSHTACFKRYSQLQDSSFWTTLKREQLYVLVADGLPWRDIGSELECTGTACKGQWIKYGQELLEQHRLAQGVRLAPKFTFQDDMLLMRKMSQMEQRRDTTLHNHLNRLSKVNFESKFSADLLYFRYLNLRRVQRTWTKKKDALLSELVKENEVIRWSNIARRFPGLTAAECESRWEIILSKSKAANPKTLPQEAGAALVVAEPPTPVQGSQSTLPFAQKSWPSDELALFWTLFPRFGIDMERVAKEMPGRSPAELRQDFLYLVRLTKQRMIQKDPALVEKPILHAIIPPSSTLSLTEQRQEVQKLVQMYSKEWQDDPCARIKWSLLSDRLQNLGISTLRAQKLWHHMQHSKEVESSLPPKHFTPQELDLIRKGHDMFGRKWTAIRDTLLPHRGIYQIRHAFLMLHPELEVSTWSITKRKLLTVLSESKVDEDVNRWDQIAKSVGDGLTPDQCRTMWNAIKKSKVSRSVSWARWEDQALMWAMMISIKDQSAPIRRDWNAMARMLNCKTVVDSQIRFVRFLEEQLLRKGNNMDLVRNNNVDNTQSTEPLTLPFTDNDIDSITFKNDWTPQEQKSLLSAVETFGLFGNWGLIKNEVRPWPDATPSAVIREVYMQLSQHIKDGDMDGMGHSQSKTFKYEPSNTTVSQITSSREKRQNHIDDWAHDDPDHDESLPLATLNNLHLIKTMTGLRSTRRLPSGRNKSTQKRNQNWSESEAIRFHALRHKYGTSAVGWNMIALKLNRPVASVKARWQWEQEHVRGVKTRLHRLQSFIGSEYAKAKRIVELGKIQRIRHAGAELATQEIKSA